MILAKDTLKILLGSLTNYRVFNGDDLACCCVKQREFGYPCEHVYTMALGSAKQLYAGCMAPVDEQTLVPSQAREAIQLSRRGRKRSSEARIPSVAERIRTRAVKCSICGDNTHNKKTCTRRSP